MLLKIRFYDGYSEMGSHLFKEKAYDRNRNKDFNLLYMVDKNRLGDNKEMAEAKFYNAYCGGARSLSDIEFELKQLIIPEIMRRYEWVKDGDSLAEHGYILVVIDAFDAYILEEDNEDLIESVKTLIETVIKIGSNVKVNCVLTAQSDSVFTYEMIQNIQNKIVLGKTDESMFEQMFENLDFSGKLGEGYIENTNRTNFNFFKNGN